MCGTPYLPRKVRAGGRVRALGTDADVVSTTALGALCVAVTLLADMASLHT